MKKIVMFSMTPLFANKSMGGAQKQLKKVALHLGALGHQVTILCTRRSDAMEPFYWHENVQVIPVYRFKQPFPEPYATPIFNIASALQDTGDYLAQADVFYSHDGGIIFPYLYQDIPTVVSLRSIVFSETLQSGYLFNGDALILPSHHTANAWHHTMGRFFPEFGERVRVIYNGLDFDVYKRTSTERIRALIPNVDPEKHRIALYPHRPEEGKGIRNTIIVADRLVNHYGMKDLRVLVPKWIDTGLSADVRQFYADLQADIRTKGLEENFVFHEWVSDDLMPEYFSLGHLTFILGSYVECFGNIWFESMACGTPIVIVKVGMYREVLSEEDVAMVQYGDWESASEHAYAILSEKRPVPQKALDWLHSYFRQEDMVSAYADVILNAEKRPSLRYHYPPITAETRFILPSWCYLSTQGIYNDFTALYGRDERLLSLLNSKEYLTFADADEESLRAWTRDGYLVPLQGQKAWFEFS